MSGAASHLYWSSQPSNKPPEALTAEAAKAAKAGAAASDKIWTPLYKWGQKGGKVILTIFVPCLEQEAVDLDIKPRTLSFRAERVAAFAGSKMERRVYTLSLQLFGEIDHERCEHFLRHDHVRVELTKTAPRPWPTLQPKNIPKNTNERPDFDLVGGDNSDDDDDETVCRTKAQSSSHSKQKAKSGWRPSAALMAAPLPAIPIDWWEAPLFLIALGYVALCPFNKVEESFGLQATHDLLYHRSNLGAYDHHSFPGVVPRSFLPPMLLALASTPFVGVLNLIGAPKITSLYCVRGVLALLSCSGLVHLQRVTRQHYGRDAYNALLLISMSQFHWLFYCSRTLPNTFASLLVLVATARWIDGKAAACVRLLTVAVVVCRAELVLLLGPLALLFLINRQISFTDLLVVGFSTAFTALTLTVAVDSIFWRRILYPEGEVLFFNTVLNKSHEYGTAPFHWYFTSALPRALLAAFPLALLAPLLVPRTRALVGIPLLFVAIYSILPHKELRFVLYAVPPLNVAAAACVAKLYAKLSSATVLSRLFGIGVRLALPLGLLLSAGCCALFLGASYSNYPGARALAVAHGIGAKAAARARKPVAVHVGVDAAMSGVSRFLELPHPWRYSKEEDLQPHEFRRFAYALTAPDVELPGFATVHTEYGFSRVLRRPPFFEYAPRIKVQARRKEKQESVGGFADDLE